MTYSSMSLNTGSSRHLPQNTWKSTFEAADGFHSVEVNRENLTKFIAHWGRYRHPRLPQGHCSAVWTCAANRCTNTKRCKDRPWRGWRRGLLSICENMLLWILTFILLNTVGLTRLSFTSVGIGTFPKIDPAIKNPRPPKDITNADMSFRPINWVQWSYFNRKERDILRPGKGEALAVSRGVNCSQGLAPTHYTSTHYVNSLIRILCQTAGSH